MVRETCSALSLNTSLFITVANTASKLIVERFEQLHQHTEPGTVRRLANYRKNESRFEVKNNVKTLYNYEVCWGGGRGGIPNIFRTGHRHG